MCLPGSSCHSHAMGNVVMITYAALSHAISVVFDRCLDMLEITRFFKDFQRLRCGCHIPHDLTCAKLWGFFMPEKALS